MSRRALALGAALLSLACTDAFFFEPPADRADFGVAFDFVAVPQFSNHGLETAFDRADVAHVVLSRVESEVVLDTIVDFDPADPVVLLSLSIEVPEEGETFELLGELLAGSEIVFQGVTTMVLYPGRGTTSEIPILPVSVDIVAPASVTFDALADTMVVPVMGLFSTGDTIPEVDVVWTVMDPSIAGSTEDGLVSHAEGSTFAIAQSGESADTVEVIVAPVVTSVDVQPDVVNADVDVEITYTATARDRRGNILERAVSWSLDDTRVAQISPFGVLVTLAEGSATVTAAVDGVEGTGSLIVSRDVPLVATVTVLPATAEILVGEALQFQAIARDAGGAQLTGRPVEWSSSDRSVASVFGSGLVSGQALGSATIRAVVEGVEGTAAVEITRPAVASVTVTPDEVEVVAGESVTLEHIVLDGDGNELTDRDVTWASSNTSVAAVSSDGLVDGVTEGAANVTATVEGVSGSSAVTVVAAIVPVATVSIVPAPAEVVVGETATLSVYLQDADGNELTGRVVDWSSPDPGIVSVSAAGQLTGESIGSTTVIALVEGVADTVDVTVIPVPVASVVVEPDTDSLIVGQQAALTATVRDPDGNVLSGRTVAWTSDATGVATVDANGHVTAVGEGVATITATSEDEAGSAVITVLSPPSFAGGVYHIEEGEYTYWGTAVVYDPTDPLDPESPLSSATIDGPPSWNSGASINCQSPFNNDEGLAPDRTLCLAHHLFPVLGDYTGTTVLGETPFPIEAHDVLAIPHITEVQTAGISMVSVAWSGDPKHASYAVEIADESDATLATALVDASQTEIVLEVSLDPQGYYYARVVAFAVDLTVSGEPFPPDFQAARAEDTFTPSESAEYWAAGASAVEMRAQPTNVLLETESAGSADHLDIVFAPDGSLAYLSDASDSGADGIRVYNVSNRAFQETFDLEGVPTESLAIDPDGYYLYATSAEGYVYQIDAEYGYYSEADLDGQVPGGVGYDPYGHEVYVSQGNGTVLVLDDYSMYPVDTVVVGSDPRSIAITAAEAWVANAGSATVSVIDLSTKSVLATVPVGAGAWDVAISPDHSVAYVANRTGGTVSVVDIANRSVLATIAVGSLPTSVAFAHDDNLAYVVNSGSSTMSIISTLTHEVIETVSLTGAQSAVAVLYNGGS